MEYLCSSGYSRLVYKWDKFIINLEKWKLENKYATTRIAELLDVSPKLILYWCKGSIIRVNTYKRIEPNLIKYNLLP